MPISLQRSAIRDGPSRLISTAESSGESNDTAAAEWITVSQLAKIARSASFRPRPSRVTSPAIVVTRLGDVGEVVAALLALGAQPVERVVLEDLAFGASCGAGSLAVADEQHELAVGDRAQQPLDERGADESGRAGDGDPFPRERFGDHG